MKTPITIVVDGNEANIVHRVGSNEYAFQIIVQLERLSRGSDWQWVVCLTQYPVDDMPPEREGWRYQIIKPRKFATQWALPLYLFAHRKEISACFTPGHYAPRLCPVPSISSVMDLAFLRFPDQFRFLDRVQLRHWTAYSVRQAARVITISEATQQDIVTTYHYPADHIRIAYPAISETLFTTHSKRTVNTTLQKFNITSQYILYVGTIQPRKNVLRLINAFEQMKRQEKKQKRQRRERAALQLVLAGKIGWLANDVITAIEHSPFRTDIIRTGFVTEHEKAVLYANAACSVLVGLYEGFGMPALESLVFRTIPVVSNTTSLPEVVGDAGILVDPESVKSIRAGIEHALSLSGAERTAFELAAAAQLKKFSWKKSGEVVLKCLQEVVES